MFYNSLFPYKPYFQWLNFDTSKQKKKNRGLGKQELTGLQHLIETLLTENSVLPYLPTFIFVSSPLPTLTS
jgi:hypothetical protein